MGPTESACSARCGHSVHNPTPDRPFELAIDLGVVVVDEGRIVVPAVGLAVQHRDKLHVRYGVLRDGYGLAVAPEDAADRRSGTSDRETRGLPIGGELVGGAAVLRRERRRGGRSARGRLDGEAGQNAVAETRAASAYDDGGTEQERANDAHTRRGDSTGSVGCESRAAARSVTHLTFRAKGATGAAAERVAPNGARARRSRQAARPLRLLVAEVRRVCL